MGGGIGGGGGAAGANNAISSGTVDVGQQQQVFASVGIGRFPFLTVLVAALERGVEARALFGFIFPDRGTDAIDADFVCGFVGGSFCRFIFAHFIFFLVWLRFAGAFCFSPRPKTNRRQKVQTKPGAIEWRAAEQKHRNDRGTMA